MFARHAIVAGLIFGSLTSTAALAQQGVIGQPNWGTHPTPRWGTYSDRIGQGGWNYERQMKRNEPVGSVLADPNQLNSNFSNPRTGAVIKIAASNKPKFKPGKALVEMVNKSSKRKAA